VGVSSCLTCVAWWWLDGQFHGNLVQMGGDRAANWLRIGVALPLMITIIAVAVLWVVSAVRAHAMALLHARVELERSHAVYQARGLAASRGNP
jgi:hypothetical protein